MNKKHICKNCAIYNFQKKECGVAILYNGEKIHLPTDPNDACFFEEEIETKVENKIEKWTPTVDQVKMWCEDPTTGLKTKKGIVKIEYPVGFFGNGEQPNGE